MPHVRKTLDSVPSGQGKASFFSSIQEHSQLLCFQILLFSYSLRAYLLESLFKCLLKFLNLSPVPPKLLSSLFVHLFALISSLSMLLLMHYLILYYNSFIL